MSPAVLLLLLLLLLLALWVEVMALVALVFFVSLVEMMRCLLLQVWDRKRLLRLLTMHEAEDLVIDSELGVRSFPVARQVA